MEDLLKDWGFDSYVGVFQDNEIDLDALKDMTADMVKEIITKIGPRAKFLSKLKLYQSIQKADVLFTSNLTAEDENQSSNASEGSLDDLQPLYIYSQKAMIGQPYKFAPVGSYSDSIVKKLLDEAPEGPAIISSYGPTKQFMRNTLCNLIIKNELKEDKGKSIPKERFIKLANEIYDLFPHEYPETYYVPYVNKTGTPKAARGKLWNAYIHMRRRFRNFGMIASTSNVNASEGLEDEIDEDKTEKVLWLKNNSTPFTMVSEFWEETYTYRKKLLATIDSYISSFPVLKEPLGYTLFEKDFEKLFKNKTNLLFNRWPQIARALIKHVFLKKVLVVLAAIEEYESANNLKLNAEELSDADQLFILINCLPMIFTSAPIKAKSQRWRPSKLEVKQGFVLQAKDAADMQLKLVQRKQKYELYGLPMQPIPILVGDIQSIEACYVNINKVFYKIDTPLKAIDVTFKIIHVLDAEYSAESKIVWLFIQQAVYQIHTDHDQNFTTVSSLRDGMIGLQECGPAPPRAPLTNKTRERTAQAVDYYNTHVHRAWANAGLSTSRSSFNDRHHHQQSSKRPHLGSEALCRSNSSLELLDQNGRPFKSSSPVLKREYGSHGSIDVIDRPVGVQGKNEFFEMLQDYRPAVLGETDQRSPGPSEYLRGKVDSEDQHDGNSHGGNYPQSPKFKSKLTRFWNNNGNIPNGVNTNNSMVKSQRQTMDDSAVSTSSSSVIFSQEAEEISRRRAFAHYDCQSLTTNLNYSVRLRRNLLAKRRNTTTGASAASMLIRSSTPDGDGEDDAGDGQSNELVESCPFFRNEIGGEEERVVSLSRLQNGNHHHRKSLHRPPLAYGVAILEFPPGETHWRHSTCPYQRFPRPIENVDQGALYYRKYFAAQEHQNWFGMDEQLGPVVISIKREKVIHPENQLTTTLTQYQYRLVVRTSELQTLRGAVLEDAIPNIKASNNPKTLNTKEVLEYVAPEIQLSSLRLGVQNQQTVDQLLKLDEQGLTNHYKVGIMYCKAGQNSEEEMYNNEEAGPAFTEFLETIGKKVKLQGFDKYKAGLDNKSDSTGLYSVYAQYQDCEIMFHVSTMLPFTVNNRQQLLRKRHIGNDIVTIVFQEPGSLPFTPKGIRSQFQHVFIVVHAINPCTENTHYKVSVSRSKDVEVFGPPIKEDAIFPKGKPFAEFLLAKVVNAENAAHRSEKFVTMATRTRQEYLKDLVTNYSTNTPVETGQKFSIFSSKKKDKIRPRFIPDLCQRGAILWQVLLDDSGQGQQIDCFLGISSDSFVLIEEQTRQIVFVTPCKSILGWSPQTNSLRIYHHQGECMTIHMRDTHGNTDELLEIMSRLKAVTNGHIAKEFSISRNIMGQLGFHVQPDGIVTLVENQGQAWQAGLRQNSRLVEICKVAVATLTYDQMVDLLKTSLTVTLTVIPPLADGSPRKGCTLQNCKYNEAHYEGDYDSMSNGTEDNTKSRRAPQMQQAVSGNHRRVYERSFSPPRSSNSSGYGTGSSSKSFHGQENRYPNNAVETVLTNSSSAHSNDDKWYDILQEFEAPPLPSKSSTTRTPQHSNNTFPCSPKRNNHHQLVQVAPTSHNHYTVQHNKIQFSNSLPLQHVNFQQPLTAALHSNTSDVDLSRDLYKPEKNNILKQHNERMRQQESSDYLQVTRPPKVAEYSTSHHGDYSRVNLNNVNDNLSNGSSISDRINLIGSEDELSTGSGNHSPRAARRSGKHANVGTNTNYSQRNQSPRSLNGEAKLRPGVTTRSANRNSANLSSNFQEELLRLINPDNIESFEQSKATKEAKSHSRDALNNLSVHKSRPEVILTTARPATVISNASTTSSPLPNEFRVSNDDGLPSPSKNKVGLPFPENFPLPEDSDWPSLVDTATRVMMQVGPHPDDDRDRSPKQWEDDLIGINRMDQHLSSSFSSIPDQNKHVVDLNRKIQTLERENRRLRDENKKFQEQAQAAVQQLRKFTEWFFKNVKRQ